MTRRTESITVEEDIGVDVCDYCGLGEDETDEELLPFLPVEGGFEEKDDKIIGKSNPDKMLHYHESCRDEASLGDNLNPTEQKLVAKGGERIVVCWIAFDFVWLAACIGAFILSVTHGSLMSMTFAAGAALFWFVVGYQRAREVEDR